MEPAAELQSNGKDDVSPQPSELTAPAARVLAWFDRNRRWLFVGIVVLYLAAFNGRWRVSPDSSLYMSLGRNLAEGAGYTYQGEHHRWFEPGLPRVIALSYRLFGEDRYAPILAFILACSLASLMLTYALMKRHAGRPTAVLVVVALAVCETYLRYGFQVVTDTPFLFAVLLYLYGYELLVGNNFSGNDARRAKVVGWLIIPAATLMMVSFRPTTLTFVGAVGVACAWHVMRGPKRWRHVAIGLLTLAAFYSFRFVDPRRGHAGESVVREQRLKTLMTTQRAYAVRHVFHDSIPDFFDKVFPQAVFATDVAPGVDTAISVALIAAGVSLLRRRVLWGMWCGATFFQCMTWLPRERYLLPILPLLLYGMWRGAVWLSSRPKLSPRASRIVLAVLMIVYFVPNLLLEGHFLIQQRYAGIDSSRNGDPDDMPVVNMGREIAQHVGDRDIVLATDHRELSYFSRRKVMASPWAFRWPPTEAEQREFFDKAARASALYAVLPDKAREQHVPALIERLGMRVGPDIATVLRPRDRKGKPQEPFTLHRLYPAFPPASAPTTAPGDGRPLPPR
jgi:hypothetical protein